MSSGVKKVFRFPLLLWTSKKNHITDGLTLKGMECMGYKRKGDITS